MSPTRIQTNAVAQFKCLGDACPDTCCQGWGMQVTPATVEKYTREAPELLDAVTSGESEYIMKRDPQSDQCVKLDGGWCSIHRDYGEDFLGDACRLFPRVSRALGDTIVTSAVLSCPESARLMLFTEDGLKHGPNRAVTVPYYLKNYLPDALDAADALGIHETFLAMAEEGTPEHALMRISATARALQMQPESAWKEAMPMYVTMAAGRIPAAEPAAVDLFHLLHALHGLVEASKAPRPPLRDLIGRIAIQLGAQFQANGVMQLTEDATERGLQCLHRMRAQRPIIEPVLRRYLQAQLSQALFPFGGLGPTQAERVTIIGVRLATIKLALTTLPEAPTWNEILFVIQTLSRFLDHLADPTLSLQIYNETGWVREARLRGLLGDA